MPPAFLFDLSAIDLDATLFDIDAIREHNPQRGDMEHLDAIVHQDGPRIVGRKYIRDDEFWIPGHIPGRPLMPGVIMLEAAAQVSSFHTATYVGWDGFIGFGGLEDVKFRTAVEPGQTLYILCELTDQRHRRVKAKCQGLVEGRIAFEATIIGTKM
jgi:3-hydroxyacyl-[acyl-carrier-protein] dehydratase